MTTDRPEGRELDIERIIRTEVARTVANTKVRWTFQQRAWIFLYVILIAAAVLYWGQRQSDRLSNEQIRFEKATVGNCQATRDIVNTFDGYLQAQIELIRHREDLSADTRNDLISNYRAHLIRPPDCSTLASP